MIYVPLGYTFGNGMFEMNEVKGGSSYGAGTYAADGSRAPTDLELQQAFHQGKYVAEITKKLKPSHHKTQHEEAVEISECKDNVKK